ncbi:hypothetical protein DsansV1_C11g0111961 [Dioscorea sansibarensis]
MKIPDPFALFNGVVVALAETLNTVASPEGLCFPRGLPSLRFFSEDDEYL